jgi:DNA-binding GntR family transcriptional regulator
MVVELEMSSTGGRSRATSKGRASQVYDDILDLIVSRELRAGDLVPERRLAERFGISRTPLREALHRLEGERILERRGANKLYVRETTVEDFMEALHLRRLLEGDAARRAAGRIPLDRLRDLRQRLQILLEGGDPSVPEHYQTDVDLHRLIVEAAGNKLLAEVVADLRRRTRMFSMKRLPERFEPICREHLAILEALEAGDPEGSAGAVAAHLDNVKQSILRKLADV